MCKHKTYIYIERERQTDRDRETETDRDRVRERVYIQRDRERQRGRGSIEFYDFIGQYDYFIMQTKIFIHAFMRNITEYLHV